MAHYQPGRTRAAVRTSIPLNASHFSPGFILGNVKPVYFLLSQL